MWCPSEACFCSYDDAETTNHPTLSKKVLVENPLYLSHLEQTIISRGVRIKYEGYGFNEEG